MAVPIIAISERDAQLIVVMVIIAAGGERCYYE
jgi:hypothetical protein